MSSASQTQRVSLTRTWGSWIKDWRTILQLGCHCCTADSYLVLNGYMTTLPILAAIQIESFCGDSLLVQAVSLFTLMDILTIPSWQDSSRTLVALGLSVEVIRRRQTSHILRDLLGARILDLMMRSLVSGKCLLKILRMLYPGILGITRPHPSRSNPSLMTRLCSPIGRRGCWKERLPKL